jgi:hypothetical protein
LINTEVDHFFQFPVRYRAYRRISLPNIGNLGFNEIRFNAASMDSFTAAQFLGIIYQGRFKTISGTNKETARPENLIF